MMTVMQIPVKYQEDEEVFATKQTKIEQTCHICEGKKTITYNGKEMKCPECGGVGKFISNKQMHVVCEEPFKVSTIKITINGSGATVKYKGRCGFNTMNRIEENLFETKEEAQKRCDDLNRERKYINLDDIIVQDSFKDTPPALDKISERLNHYKEHGVFTKDITIDKENILIDGYITYLICKLLNKDLVKVIVE
jgi:excinuclease UvrABC ATPase subunit